MTASAFVFTSTRPLREAIGAIPIRVPRRSVVVNEPGGLATSSSNDLAESAAVPIRLPGDRAPCGTSSTNPAPAEGFLFVRKQPEQNVFDPAGFLGNLSEAFHDRSGPRRDRASEF